MQTFFSISYFEICPPPPFQLCLSGILVSGVKVLPTPCTNSRWTEAKRSGFFFGTDFLTNLLILCLNTLTSVDLESKSVIPSRFTHCCSVFSCPGSSVETFSILLIYSLYYVFHLQKFVVISSLVLSPFFPC